MARIAVGPGHLPPDFGAYGFGLAEFKEANHVSIYTADFLRNLAHDVFEFYGTLEQKVDSINQWEADIAMEIHFNAVRDTSVGGTEVLYYPTSKYGELLAQSIQTHLLKDLDLRDRKIKSRPKLYFLRKTYCPSVIVEPLFITNRDDVVWLIEEGHHTIADAIGKGIRDYLESL